MVKLKTWVESGTWGPNIPYRNNVVYSSDYTREGCDLEELDTKKESDFYKICSDVYGIFEEDTSELSKRAFQEIEESSLAGDYLEVGSMLGRSSNFFSCYASKNDRKLFCVDNWNLEATLKAFKQSLILRGLNDCVETIKADSDKAYWAWGSSHDDFSFIYIDAGHRFEDVKIDFSNWKNKLVLGGFILFHDYDNVTDPGVYRAIEEIVRKDEDFVEFARSSRAVLFKRVKRK